MTRRKYRTSNLTADAAARKWADYMRLRRRPEKACWGCEKVFPNTLEHFAAGARGRVGVRCHACVAANPAPTRVKASCPCCGVFTRLVVDRHAPAPVMVCRSCLKLVNMVLATDAQTLARMEQYVEWRRPAPRLS